MFNISRKTVAGAVCAVFAIIVLCMLGRIGEDVKNETIVVNQFPISGRMEYWTTAGFKWQWCGKTTTYHKTEQLWFGGKDIDDQAKTNNYWIRQIGRLRDHGVDAHTDYKQVVQAQTPTTIAAFMQEFLKPGNRAEVIMLPEE